MDGKNCSCVLRDLPPVESSVRLPYLDYLAHVLPFPFEMRGSSQNPKSYAYTY